VGRGTLLAFTYAGYIVAGYAITAAALGGYLAWLFRRARRARDRVAAVAAKRTG
jgi:heme exporter protein CcmD